VLLALYSCEGIFLLSCLLIPSILSSEFPDHLPSNLSQEKALQQAGDSKASKDFSRFFVYHLRAGVCTHCKPLKTWRMKQQHAKRV
jgi:hypothetical protein